MVFSSSRALGPQDRVQQIHHLDHAESLAGSNDLALGALNALGGREQSRERGTDLARILGIGFGMLSGHDADRAIPAGLQIVEP